MTNELNNKINELYKIIDAKDNIINQQALEIARLNEDITWWTNRFNAVERDNRNLKEEIARLKKRINQALHKLKSSVNHFKTQRENNAVTFTIKILGDKENE